MIDPIPVAIVSTPLFLVFFVWALRVAAKRREELELLFADAARQLGGRYTASKRGPFTSRSPKVVSILQDTEVVADTYTVKSGKNSTTYSRVVAPYSFDRGPQLHIRRQHALNTIGKLLGMQDLELGDPAFDEAFMIKGPSAEAVARVLEPEHRLALLHQLPGWWLKSDGSTVKLKRIGRPDSPAELVQAVRVAAAVASADKRILDRAATLPDARSERAAVIFETGGAKGRFTVEERECVLRTPNAKGGPPFGVNCAATDAGERLPQGALEPALAAHLNAVGEALLERDAEHAWIAWRKTPDASQIEAAWRILVGVAGPSTRVGAFR